MRSTVFSHKVHRGPGFTRHECHICGREIFNTTAGNLRAHRQMRVRRAGPYISDDMCPGGGQPVQQDTP